MFIVPNICDDTAVINIIMYCVCQCVMCRSVQPTWQMCYTHSMYWLPIYIQYLECQNPNLGYIYDGSVSSMGFSAVPQNLKVDQSSEKGPAPCPSDVHRMSFVSSIGSNHWSTSDGHFQLPTVAHTLDWVSTSTISKVLEFAPQFKLEVVFQNFKNIKVSVHSKSHANFYSAGV